MDRETDPAGEPQYFGRGIEWRCNTEFSKNLLQTCYDGATQKLRTADILSAGAARAVAAQECLYLASTAAEVVTAAGPEFHAKAQDAQRKYEANISGYLQDVRSGAYLVVPGNPT